MLPIFGVFLAFVKFSLKNKEDGKVERYPKRAIDESKRLSIIKKA
jgi:hypothetical protein